MKIGSEILWLSESDVASLLTIEDALEATENAFRQHGLGQVQLPPKIYLTFEPFGGDLRAMPAYIKAPVNAAGVKVVNSNPSNPSRQLPAVTGIMVYVDPKTGMPLGVFSAGTLTALRTGAAGGVAAKYLARKNSNVIGLVGCGRQAQTQLDALRVIFPLTKVLVWGRMEKESETFCESNRMESVDMVPCSEIKRVCEADIIVTTTPSRVPVVQAQWVRKGTHINAIGADAPGKQELATDLLLSARVVVDEWSQAAHAGEINSAVSQNQMSREKIVGQLGEIIAGRLTGRQADSDVTVFDSTGLAIQDVSVSRFLFEKAVKINKGQVLKLHG